MSSDVRAKKVVSLSKAGRGPLRELHNASALPHGSPKANEPEGST